MKTLVRHSVRLVVLGVALGALLYLGYLGWGMLP